MRALVMAAGLGTRLRPLTDTLPKPLVALRGRPMVAHVLDQLARQGIEEAILNIHYFPEKMRAFVYEWNAAGRRPSLKIQDESALILDSGGSIPVAAPWLFEREGTALVCNADVLADPDLKAFAAEHARLKNEFGAECSLAITPHPEVGAKYNGLARDAAGRITGFVGKTGKADPSLFHFPGYYLLEEKALNRLPKPGAVFGIKEALWQPLAAEGKLGSYLHQGDYLDLGTPADLKAAEEYLAARA